MKILIADDSLFMRLNIRKICEQVQPVEIEEAKNGLEAINVCDSFKPHLIFMDVTMPQMNGLEAAKVIKQKHPLVKIVICSAVANTQQVRQNLHAAEYEIIAKPFVVEEILKVLQAVSENLPQ